MTFFRSLAIVFVFAVVLFPSGLSAADRQVAMRDFVQEVWDSKDERLPHPGLTSILQTRDGYLWLGTFGGLARFDGVRFHLPGGGNVPALSDHVKCLAETEDGSLWVGTRREGLVRIKDGKITVLTTKDGLAANDTRALAATPDGNVWIGTAAGIVVRHPDGTMQKVGREQGLPHEIVQTLFVDRDGTLWVGTSEYGLAWWDGAGFHAVDLAIGAQAAAATSTINISSRAVLAIGRDAAGAFYAGTSVGLLRLADERTPKPGRSQLLSDPVLCLFGTSRGTLWASTAAGLARIDGNEIKRYTSRDGLLHDSVPAIYEDAERSLWLGTRVGLARLRRRSITALTERDGLPSNVVLSVLEGRNGDLWVGTRAGVARRRAGVWKTFDVAHGLPNPTARALAEAPDGTIWVGTMNGVARFDDRRGRFVAFPSVDNPYAVRAIAFDGEGCPWFGAFDGLDRLENGKITRFLPRAEICERAGTYYLLARPDGTIWAGASAALVEIRDDKQVCHVDKDAASRNDVRHLYVDHDGVFWVGSIGGLSRWVGGKRETLKGNAGPFNTAIYAMVEDGRGSMWVSTPKGLFEIVKKDIDRYADADAARTLYHAYGVSDGMESSVGTGDGQPNAWRGADGRLYFTTATGLAVVDPREIEHGTQPPPVYVDRMVANREAVDLRGARRLAAGTRDLEIEFSALSFVAPDRVTYRYMLEGFDRSWVDSGTRREAFYTNLPPRHYRFRVKAANHSGVWNEQGFTVDFEILPRFYQRAWFAPLCVALAAAAAVSVYRMRIAALRARETELRRAVNEAVASVQVIRGLLPVCATCRRVKQDSGSWRQIEAYVMEHTEATFSHTMCDECYGKMREEDPNLPELGKL